MLERVANTLDRSCGAGIGSTILIGVSGGPDSLCLLDILRQINVHLVAAHLNHQLRPEAEDEAAAVEAFARKLGIPIVIGIENAGAFAASEQLSIEEAARILRYRFLFRQAEAHGAQAVAVAHTADDQVETVLMHFLRGAGLQGLKGMSFRSLPNLWSDTIALVRPLLDIWRQEIDAYHLERGIHPSMDPSNLDTRLYRNRLRHELIPYLRQYNPNVQRTLWRTAEVLREDDAALEKMVDEAWKTCVTAEDEGYIALDKPAILQQPAGIQRRIVRRAIALLRPGLRDIGFEAVDRVLTFMHSPSASGQRDLAAGLRLQLAGERLYLAEWETRLPIFIHARGLQPGEAWPQIATEGEIELPVPGGIDLPGGWRLEARLVENDAALREPDLSARALENEDPYQAMAAVETLVFPLTVRSRRPGDRFAPLGMDNHQTKLADFFINQKLPEPARDRWPLVCSQERIAWIPGFRLGHPFRLQKDTRKAVLLQLFRRE